LILTLGHSSRLFCLLFSWFLGRALFVEGVGSLSCVFLVFFAPIVGLPGCCASVPPDGDFNVYSPFVALGFFPAVALGEGRVNVRRLDIISVRPPFVPTRPVAAFTEFTCTCGRSPVPPPVSVFVVDKFFALPALLSFWYRCCVYSSFWNPSLLSC